MRQHQTEGEGTATIISVARSLAVLGISPSIPKGRRGQRQRSMALSGIASSTLRAISGSCSSDAATADCSHGRAKLGVYYHTLGKSRGQTAKPPPPWRFVTPQGVEPPWHAGLRRSLRRAELASPSRPPGPLQCHRSARPSAAAPRSRPSPRFFKSQPVQD